MEPPAIETRNLVQRYGDFTALAGLDLSVPQGMLFGLLGPNGAGKTTLVSVLTTLLKPSEGTAHLLGHDLVRESLAVRQSIGLVFQESTLDVQLTGFENLDFHGRFYHLENRRQRVEEALDQVGLSDVADQLVRTYSGGMKRRLEIARGLLPAPEVLFLDEPTLGLDVQARAEIWKHLRTLTEQHGTTVFLTTHSMEEADILCQRIGILDRGRLVAEGEPEILKAELGGDVVVFDLEHPDDVLDRLRSIDGVQEVILDANLGADAETSAKNAHPLVRVVVAEGSRRMADLIDVVRDAGINEVALHRPRLEHVFLHHTGHAFEPIQLGNSRSNMSGGKQT